MMIRVIYTDDKFDMVAPKMLDYLLGRNKISSFNRSSGWAVVGRDVIRSKSSNGYRGEERRAG